MQTCAIFAVRFRECIQLVKVESFQFPPKKCGGPVSHHRLFHQIQLFDRGPIVVVQVGRVCSKNPHLGVPGPGTPDSENLARWQLKDLANFYPGKFGEDESILTIYYFSNGLVQPPTRNSLKSMFYIFFNLPSLKTKSSHLKV